MKNKLIQAYKTGLGWGISMFILMVFVWPYFNDEPIPPKSIGIGCIAWIIVGSFLSGYVMNLKRFKSDK